MARTAALRCLAWALLASVERTDGARYDVMLNDPWPEGCAVRRPEQREAGESQRP